MNGMTKPWLGLIPPTPRVLMVTWLLTMMPPSAFRFFVERGAHLKS